MSEEKKLDFYINKYITYYKNNFSKIWEDENFKWKAIKCFQDNWDINAKDFLKMLDNSFAQTYNLLSSNQYFPLKMIKLYANYDCQKVRAMFLDLYNEDKDIIERISNFKKSSEDLCNMYTPGYQHYQKENAITVYLWLKNPDKYYIFKFGEIKSVAEKLHSEYDFRKGAYENNIRNHIKLYDLICNILQDDFELKKIFYSHLDETCYQDPYMKTLTIDFGYYVANIDSKIAIENIEVNNKLQSKNYPQLKNQILYGPPGTGKTYNTVIKAIEITNPELIQKDKDGNVENYELLKEKFDELKQQGQIEFVTFHQSYSYEEFVEGIKPDISKWNDDGSELKYVGKDGIFKNICEHAKPIKVSSIKHQPIDFSNTKVFKMSLGNTLEKEDDIYEYCISNNVVALGFKDVDFSDCKTSQDFKDKDDSWGATALERFVNWMDIGDIIIVSNGNRNFRAIAQVTGDYYYDRTTPIRYSHFRKVEWLYKGEDIYYSKINNKVFSQQSIYGYFDPSKKGMPNYNPDLNTQELNNIITGKVDKEIALPHILIIDEINRGNISKIFGELITLIEEDKRGTLSVKLPYSQDDFTVPKNLYIIGTMNTSDRSIASIDIALRRRFKFVEMMPRPELVSDFGCSFQSIFEKLNTKIKILLDRDHQIGHSYFINTKYANADTNILKEIWFSEIIPLLNEYFYCDWEKLKLVIPGFIKEITIPEELKNDCEDSMYEFKTPNEVKDFVGALKQDKFKQED